MSLAPANPDSTTSAPTAAAPSSPPSPPSPPSPLPPLSPHNQSLLAAFTAARFDVLAFAAAAKISAVELANFAAHPDIQAHIDALTDLARKSLHLRASQARHTAINKLEAVAQHSDDPIETRRAASQLLRATSSPIVGTCHGLSGSSTQTVREPAKAPKLAELSEASFVPPPPFETPELNFSPEQVARTLAEALVDTPDVDPDDRRGNALATFAAFADHNSTVNGETIATENDSESFQSVGDSAVIRLLNASAHSPIMQTALTESRATLQTTITHGNPKSPNRCTRHITFELTKQPDSREPNCWLITTLTVSPPTYPNAIPKAQNRANSS